MNEPWPTTDLDPVRRLRALAGGIRGAHVTEAYIDAPFERVWDLLGDLDGGFGRVVPDMERLRVVRRQGERVEALARSKYGMRARLRGVQRPGWCWLQSRFLLVGVAATPDGAGTRVAFTGGVRLPTRAALIPLGVRREGGRSVQRLTALL
ncbi:SRPBCC family protein [Streptomyces cinnabarinus]|uniref:SRPBCC family protein n=1 Tax=Streptomyces cinnabarinus TaxID=67287 RepID=A0ABY7K7H9_9ACTN|nr:SRPBCC family protein [Streptomyces cinnabarinus]WAZ19117.1 SRPBCC family protein [Streptomyces cinnabarinus]